MNFLKQGDLVKWNASDSRGDSRIGILLQILDRGEFPGLIVGDVLCSDGKRYEIYLRETAEDLA